MRRHCIHVRGGDGHTYMASSVCENALLLFLGAGALVLYRAKETNIHTYWAGKRIARHALCSAVGESARPPSVECAGGNDKRLRCDAPAATRFRAQTPRSGNKRSDAVLWWRRSY